MVETWARMDLLEGTQSATTAQRAEIKRAPAPEIPALIETPQTPAVANPRDLTKDDPPLFVDSSTTAMHGTPAATVSSAAAPAESSDSLMWRLGGELSLNERDSTFGVNGSVCGRFAFLCLGASARFGRSEDSSLVDAMISASIPLSFGPVTLSPAVGFGGGWRTSSPRINIRWDPRNDNFDEGELSPRAEARVDLAFRFSGNFALQVGTSATFEVTRLDREPELDAPLVRAYAGLAWGSP